MKKVITKYLRFFAGIVSFFYVFLCYITSKVNVIDKENSLPKLNKTSAIIPVWHNRILIATPFFAIRLRKRKCFSLVSASDDASFLRIILKMFRVRYVKGSTNKITFSNIKEIFNLLKNSGSVFFITPDGPVGPRMNFNYGAAQIALGANVPVLPVYIGVKHGFILKTWDRLILPRPFSTITVVVGKLTKQADVLQSVQSKTKIEKIETLRNFFEQEMLNLSAEHDKQFNVATILQEGENQGKYRRYKTTKTK